MVVDALMQIPWLSGIISVVSWLAHAVISTIAAGWRMVVLFFTTYIPLILAWASQRLVHWLAVIAAWVLLLSLLWSLVLAFLERIVEWTVPVDDIAAFGGQWWDWIWNDPIRLNAAWAYVKRMPPIIAGVVSIRIVWRRLRWAMVTMK